MREREREKKGRDREKGKKNPEKREGSGWRVISGVIKAGLALMSPSPVSPYLLFNFPNEHTSVIVGVVARRTDEYRRYVYQPFSGIDM